MKVVLDTNVLIAAFATQGLCHAVFEVCIDQHQIVLSEQILKEFASNMERKLKAPSGVVDDAVQFLRDHSSIHKAEKLLKRISRDAADDHILALADETNADYVITGDKDLLILKKYKKVPIILPREFWETLRKIKK
jgi:putative PIN family toxin of toxin-antitoxin system